MAVLEFYLKKKKTLPGAWDCLAHKAFATKIGRPEFESQNSHKATHVPGSPVFLQQNRDKEFLDVSGSAAL